MELYIKQKVFSWTDRFSVVDKTGMPRYTVEGELFSWGKKLHVFDAAGREAAFIQQKIFTLLPRFFVFVDGTQVAEVVKEFSLFRPRYTLVGPDWDIDGSFLAHDYEITRNGLPVALIHKEWMSWGDSYAVDISEGFDEVQVLAVVLAIDCVMDAAERAAN